MDSTSYDFLHRITNLIFKSKAGMAYDKSIINIDINFDNEDQAIPKLPKPILPRKDRKDKIATIQPSAESRKTSAEIERRVQELQKFRRESQSAVEAPLLVTALVKKTNQRLDSIEVSGFFSLALVQEDKWLFNFNAGVWLCTCWLYRVRALRSLKWKRVVQSVVQ